MTKGKIGWIIVLLLLLVGVSCFAYSKYTTEKNIAHTDALKVILAVDSRQMADEDAQNIVQGYQSVLEEEGISYQKLDIYQLVSMDAAKLAGNTPMILFPDRAALYLPEETAEWAKNYIEHGGTVAAVYDAGTRNKRDKYLNRAVFSSLLDFNYCTFNEEGDDAYYVGKFQFTSKENRDYWGIPEGKTVDDTMLSGYSYGALELPVRSINGIGNLSPDELFANVLTMDGKIIPGLVRKKIGKGNMVYMNLPLGALKVNADDLMLRSFLRTVAFRFAKMPHVMNVADGKGAIILNWHIDSDEELDNLPELIEGGFLHKNLPMSFHVTAGEFLNEPGDGRGFHASSEQGRAILEQLKEYGRVGSHGGWAHNWFAKNLFAGNFSEDETRHYIQINNEAVEADTGCPVTEYSAPDGVYPQPLNTKLIESMGIIAYYYTGDSGSFMNRTFYNGKMVSDKTIAVPIMPLGKYASLEEMRHLGNLPPETVTDWMESMVRYSHDNRTIRMFYSHPYDLAEYPELVMDYLDWLDGEVEDEHIRVITMTDAVTFYKRFLETKYTFQRKADCLHVTMENPAGLKDITAAVPKEGLKKFEQEGFEIDEDDQYYYITVSSDDKTKIDFDIPCM